MNHVIEYIGRDGVKTTPIQFRAEQPKPGDPIYIPKDMREYPWKWPWARIEGQGRGPATKEELHVCCDQGSVFLGDGYVSISGGPFAHIKPDDLKPTLLTKCVRFWNWGDNHSGASQGVEYNIDRPVFVLASYKGKETAEPLPLWRLPKE